MQSPEDVAAMLRLKACGWGTKRIADELGEWLKVCFLQHAGNAAVVLQDLQLEHGLTLSLRTVERSCAPLRQALAAEAKAPQRGDP